MAYASGATAISLSRTADGLLSAYVFDDTSPSRLRAYFSAGLGVVYHMNGKEWVVLTATGGFEYEAGGTIHRTWSWAQPVQLQLHPNRCLAIQITGRFEVYLRVAISMTPATSPGPLPFRINIAARKQNQLVIACGSTHLIADSVILAQLRRQTTTVLQKLATAYAVLHKSNLKLCLSASRSAHVHQSVSQFAAAGPSGSPYRSASSRASTSMASCSSLSAPRHAGHSARIISTMTLQLPRLRSADAVSAFRTSADQQDRVACPMSWKRRARNSYKRSPCTCTVRVPPLIAPCHFADWVQQVYEQ